MKYDPSLLPAALNYAGRGWAVFPVHGVLFGRCACGNLACSDAGKHPIVAGGLLAATTETAQVRAWWSRTPSANIGINCGRSGLTVLDVDPRHGGDETLRMLRASLGASVFETLTSLTGGGGEHLWYTAPDGVRIPSGANVLGPGLDVRADGGYVIAPPSLHVNGSRYEWDAGSPEGLIELPAALLPLFFERGGERLRQDGRALVISPGERNHTLFRFGSLLRRYGLGEIAIFEALCAINDHHCTDPLDEQELRRIAASAAAYPPATVPEKSGGRSHISIEVA